MLLSQKHLPDLIFLGFACILSWAAFHGVSDLGFDSDDLHYIQNAATTLNAPERLFDFHQAFPFGRPTTELFFLISYAIFEGQATVFHMLLIGVHITATVLFALYLKQSGYPLQTCSLSALLFLLNVAHFRAVYWISCLAYPLTLVFGLAVLMTYQKYLSTRHYGWLLLAAFAQISAIGAHPAGLFFSLFCVYLGSNLPWQQNFRSVWLLCFVTASTIGLQILAYTHTSQMSGIAHEFSAMYSLLAFIWYWSRLWTTSHWLVPKLSEPAFYELAFGLVLLGAFALYARRHMAIREGFLWAILALLPFINNATASGGDADGPSRFLYMASAGASLMLAHGLCLLSKYLNTKHPTAICGIAFGAITISSLISLDRVEAITLYTSGRSHMALGQYDEGRTQLQKALTKDPNLLPKDAYYRLANASFYDGIPQTAIFQKAFTRVPNDMTLLCLLGLSETLENALEIKKQGEKRVIEALAYFETDPTDFKYIDGAFTNLGIYYLEQGFVAHAENLFKIPLHFSPNDPTRLFNFGLSLLLQEDSDAFLYFEHAMSKDPSMRIKLQEQMHILLSKHKKRIADLLSNFLASKP